MRPKIILKFGGTSLASPEALKQAVSIIQGRMEERPLVVVSAPGADSSGEKITDILEKLGRSVIRGKPDRGLFQTLKERLVSLLEGSGLSSSLLTQPLEYLADLLLSIEEGIVPSPGTTSTVRQSDPLFEKCALDGVMGMGEIFSTEIMAELLRKGGLPFKAVRPEGLCLVTNRVFQDATVLESSLEEMAKVIIAGKEHLVVPGYIGTSEDGMRTTLGRGGSDYTAAALGAALKRDVEIWTDVNGVYRANPAYFPGVLKSDGHPETIPSLSHDEAFQMAAFGSRVLYGKTLHAAGMAAKKGKHLRITIRNTFEPDHPGTVITSLSQNDGRPKGITCLDGTQLLTFYPESEEEAAGISKEVLQITGSVVKVSSFTSGRLSFVFDAYCPELSALESRFSGHLSRDQILLKIVGDGLGENHEILARIHQSLDFVESPEKYGMTLVHKTPHLLTDNTFEVVVKKRGIQEVVLQLYKDLFMEKIIQVGLLGLGTVGTGVLKYHKDLYSEEKTGYQVRFPVVVVRDPQKPRSVPVPGVLTTEWKKAVDDPRIDVILELMGGIEPAREIVLRALKGGKHVVTANKALLASHGKEIFSTAAKYGRNIGFEASVCGEIPVIEDFLKIPSQQDILGIEGIVNGTSNYILTRLQEGMEFADAVREAQEKGFAETDPSFDLGGADGAQKLAILSSILFNAFFDWTRIPRESIEAVTSLDVRITGDWGYAVKPLAIARRTLDNDQERFHLFTGPYLIRETHPLYSVKDETNAVSLFLRGRSDPITKVGKGAGAIPTARSIMKDVLEVAKKSKAKMVDLPRFYLQDGTGRILPQERASSPFYLRFSVQDLPGVFGKITTILGEHGLSIKTAVQQETAPSQPPNIVLMIKETPSGKVTNALAACKALEFVHGVIALPVLLS
ncbi:MAG: homoserine dehydrogenase [Armatimonadetes bacterium]|nr:homoserine dehydrogenase [Armatimonadota bacterium]